MTIDPQGFPLDLTGENPRNLVVNDTRTIAGNDDSVFVPDGGPFFTRTLVIQSGSKTLIPNVDYKCLHLLKDASVQSGLDVSAVVMITNDSISNITMNYQVIGGQYGETVPVIRQLLENADNLEKSISWNTHIYAKPDLFEPAPHFVSGEDFSDWASVLNGFQAIERAIMLKDVAAWESAFQYVDNLITQRLGLIDLSNFYTKSQVNLELVKLALKTDVYTKTASNQRHYSKTEVNALIGDIDGNETYYTESEINSKFIESSVADAKFATKAEVNRVDSAKADKSSVYTRVQIDDRFPLKTTVYNKDYIDTTFVIKGTSYTKAESDTRYALKSDAYTKVDSDKRYALKSQIISAPDLSQFMSRDESDAIYLKINNADVIYLRKTTADSLYAKHTDLHVITTLTNKFKDYYTKVETDSKFITTTAANSAFLTKASATSLYFTKTYTNAVFATKVELADLNVDLVKKIGEKADRSYVESSYYTSNQTEQKFYNKIESDAKYPSYSYLSALHYTKQEMLTKFDNYYTTGVVDSLFNVVNTAIANRYTKSESDGRYYTKSQGDAKYALLTSLSSEVSRLTGLINLKAADSWVKSTYYTKADINSNYYTQTQVNSAFYSKTESNSRFHLVSDFNNAIKAYATTTSLNTVQSNLTTAMNARYTKSETYSKAETDNRYLPLNNSIIEISGSTGNERYVSLVISNNHPTADTTGSIQFKVRDQINTIIGGGYSVTDKEYRFDVNLKRPNQNAVGLDFYITPSKMWHRAYGYLHDYFLSKNDSYSKAESYSKSQLDARYLQQSVASSTYVTKSEFNTYDTSVKYWLSQKAEKLDLNRYAELTTLRNEYYNKVYIDNNYLTGRYINDNFVTKVDLNVATTKLLSRSAFDVHKVWLDASFANAVTHTEALEFARKSWVETTYVTYTKLVEWYDNISETAAKYYNRTQSDGRYAYKSDFTQHKSWTEQNMTVALSRSEAYKIGDIYITSLNHASSASVNSHHGYGTWERYAQGRTLVGISTTGWTDGSVNSSDMIPYFRDYNTMTIGNRFGAYQHKLTDAQMPSHDHVTRYPYNKLAGLSEHVGATYGWVDSYTADGSDNRNPYKELAVMGQNAQMLRDATIKSEGGDQPHGIIQPSIVVGMWKRVR